MEASHRHPIDLVQHEPSGPADREDTGPPLAPKLLIVGLLALGSLAAGNAILRLWLIASASTMQSLPEAREMVWLANPIAATMHLLPGIGFVVLGPLQFSSAIHERWPRWHRRSGRVYVASALAVGITSIWLVRLFPARGILMDSSAWVFGCLLIFSVVRAVIAIRRGDVARHRAWMIRGYSIGLAVATQRLVLGAWQLSMGGVAELDIGAIVWSVWILHAICAEFIVRRSRTTGLNSGHSSLATHQERMF